MEPMERILVTREGDAAVVRFLDRKLMHLEHIHQMADELAKVAAGARHVVLDLTGVQMLSSMALNKFVVLERKLRKEGGKLGVVPEAPVVVDVFRMTGLERTFVIRGAVDEALRAIRESEAAENKSADNRASSEAPRRSG